MTASEEDQNRVRERRKQLVQLKLAGLDWATIADRCGYSSGDYARLDYRRAREASKVELHTSVEEARWLEVDRLDRLQAAVWPKALKGDTKAADTAHRLIVSRCKILGLEAPTQIQLNARMDLESTIVAETIVAVIDALGLEPSARMLAFDVAQKRLAITSGDPIEEELP